MSIFYSLGLQALQEPYISDSKCKKANLVNVIFCYREFSLARGLKKVSNLSRKTLLVKWSANFFCKTFHDKIVKIFLLRSYQIKKSTHLDCFMTLVFNQFFESNGLVQGGLGDKHIQGSVRMHVTSPSFIVGFLMTSQHY